MNRGAPDPGAGPWPATATRDDDGVLHIGGIALTDIAERYGTPLWVVDEDDIRARCRTYRKAFPNAEVAYASKAWCTTGILQLVVDEGLWVDVASGGELHTARVAGVPMDRVVFHGNNKSVDELRLAADLRVARIVVDSFDELARVDSLGVDLGRRLPIWLRITPGIDAHTHEYVRTGHDDTKFGFTLSLGLAEEAVERTQASPNVDLRGIHAHIGSQIFGADAFVANVDVLVALLADGRAAGADGLTELNLGGGMGIRYTHEDHPADVAHLGAEVSTAIADACDAHGIDPPTLFLEPGRAIVGPSTVTLYRVGTVKELPGIRTYVSVDGGMSDNIRPALYEAEHETALANRAGEGRAAYRIVGKHCESGDLVADRASLPADLRVDDLIVVAATGAYTEAMSSNYNRLPRPGAVLVRDGEVRELIRREMYDDLVARDVPIR